MAQLDFTTFFTQILWLTLSFCFIYWIIRTEIVVKLSKTYKLRNKLLSLNTGKSDNNQKYNLSYISLAYYISKINKNSIDLLSSLSSIKKDDTYKSINNTILLVKKIQTNN